jgi:hypothetical protein
MLVKASGKLTDQTRPDQRAAESTWETPAAKYCSVQSSHRKFNTSSHRTGSPTSKHIKCLEKNKNLVMGPDDDRNQERLFWQRPAENYYTKPELLVEGSQQCSRPLLSLKRRPHFKTHI